MKRQILIYTILLVFLVALGPVSMAQSGEVPRAQPTTLSATGIIVAKEKRGVTLKGGEYFRVPFGVKILSTDEKPLPFRMLPVPCKAEVQYVKRKNSHAKTATVIKVLHIPKGARAGWRSPVPE
ncbi:MAG: hypothetical protein DRH12_04255 [Deltaproteobacteria bacterium]|nr:MAG: hypothetical protein DRH12_04255 [Deltaproteobacteria bacterium]